MDKAIQDSCLTVIYIMHGCMQSLNCLCYRIMYMAIEILLFGVYIKIGVLIILAIYLLKAELRNQLVEKQPRVPLAVIEVAYQ